MEQAADAACPRFGTFMSSIFSNWRILARCGLAYSLRRSRAGVRLAGVVGLLASRDPLVSLVQGTDIQATTFVCIVRWIISGQSRYMIALPSASTSRRTRYHLLDMRPSNEPPVHALSRERLGMVLQGSFLPGLSRISETADNVAPGICN